jgi:hypothetical protein
MSRPVVAVFAVIVMLLLASQAAATVGGPCITEINGEDIGAREVGATSDPIVVSKDRPVSVTMTSEQELERLKVELEFSGLRWTVHDRPATGTSWRSEVPVDDYADFGLGLYKVVGSSEGADFTCEGAALIEVAGDNELDPLKTPIALAGIALALIGSLGVLAIALRVGRSRTSPVFAGLLGAVFGLGIVILLQQFSAIYPTVVVTVGVVLIGAALGLALGLFGLGPSRGDAVAGRRRSS